MRARRSWVEDHVACYTIARLARHEGAPQRWVVRGWVGPKPAGRARHAAICSGSGRPRAAARAPAPTSGCPPSPSEKLTMGPVAKGGKGGPGGRGGKHAGGGRCDQLTDTNTARTGPGQHCMQAGRAAPRRVTSTQGGGSSSIDRRGRSVADHSLLSIGKHAPHDCQGVPHGRHRGNGCLIQGVDCLICCQTLSP